MNDNDDTIAVLRGKKLALEEVISSYERQLPSDVHYRRNNASQNRQLKHYLQDKNPVDNECVVYHNKHLLRGDFNLPSKFMKVVSGATGFGKKQSELSGKNLKINTEMQRKISGYDRRSQNVCIAIARTNDGVALLDRKFGKDELLKVAKSQTLAGLKVQLIKTSQELATAELAEHRFTPSGIGVARVWRPGDTFQADRVSEVVKRFVSEK